MENASKALIMAGSVLIALIVISLLVMFFGRLRSFENTKQGIELDEKGIEFNKQYEAYERNVYGSELLSIVNKIQDYNERNNTEYTNMDLELKLNIGIDEKYFEKGKTYNCESILKSVNDLEKAIKEAGDVKIKSSKNIYKKVSELAIMRKSDITYLGFPDKIEENQDVQEYNKYKAIYTEFKQTKFKYVKFEYDKNTGRVIKMLYKN